MTEVTQAPPMTFRVQDLMDPKAFSEGPFIVFWNADGSSEYVEPGGPLDIPPPPKIGRFKRMRGFKPWRCDVRLTPGPDQSLAEFGEELGTVLDLPVRPPSDDDAKAIWLPGILVARNSAEALGSTGRLLNTITDVLVSSVQVKVQAL